MKNSVVRHSLVEQSILRVVAGLTIWCLCGVRPAAAQKLIVTLKLDSDQIGLVGTAQGLTTRLAFPDPVKEVICGDLYDPASGKGTFVVQRSDNDVFIKPITTKGVSNLFVRTGDKLHRIYNFDLSIVSFDKAYRVVNVESETAAGQRAASANGTGAAAGANGTGGGVAGANETGNADASTATDDSVRDARAQADEIVRAARQQASRIVAEAQQAVDEMQRQAISDAPQQVQRRFISALLGGLNGTRTSNAQVVTSKKVIVRLDKEMYTFEGRTYMRYTIQNSGKENFVYSEIRLEAGSQKHLPAEVIQSKPENKVVPGETVAGIIAFDQKAFDQKLTNPKAKLVLSVQDKDDNTVTHIVVLQ